MSNKIYKLEASLYMSCLSYNVNSHNVGNFIKFEWYHLVSWPIGMKNACVLVWTLEPGFQTGNTTGIWLNAGWLDGACSDYLDPNRMCCCPLAQTQNYFGWFRAVQFSTCMPISAVCQHDEYKGQYVLHKFHIYLSNLQTHTQLFPATSAL